MRRRFCCLQVSPTEIESELRKLEGVVDCAVVGKPDTSAGELPLGFIVKSGVEPTEAQVHNFLKSKFLSAQYSFIKRRRIIGFEFFDSIWE